MTKCLAELKRRPRKVEDPDAQEPEFGSLSSLAALRQKQANDLVLHTNLKLLRLLICQQQITSFEDNVELKRLSQSDEGSQADSNNFLQIVAKRKPVQSWSGYHMGPPTTSSTIADTLFTSHGEINVQQVPYDQGWGGGVRGEHW